MSSASSFLSFMERTDNREIQIIEVRIIEVRLYADSTEKLHRDGEHGPGSIEFRTTFV